MALLRVGRCDLLEQTFLQCDSLLHPPPPFTLCPPPPLLHSNRFKHRHEHANPASCTLSPVAAPPLHSTPTTSRLRGDSLTVSCSSSFGNDWHHQPPYPLRPFCMDDVLSCRMENSWREAGERRRVYVCEHNSNLCI
ncbi:hypothetical protein KUCAC02_001773 [Chaenocephalus aceratus]|uniref:Uncharacterized protein n=1 Tax=Chaenocephalus aceratus TaxID=36190 RepID=A0ACB9XSJ2_CHAAC|nr:hypothetical protein KUCAC02_001773 [Chaenocephalus aceratus]